MNRRLAELLDNLFPPVCILCESQGQSAIDLCPACQADLPWIRDCCSICAIPLMTGQAGICGKCIQKVPTYSKCISAFEYRYPIDKMIINFKSRGQLITGKVLASLTADVIPNRLKGNQLPDLIIPVPLHRARLRDRGFNQSLEIADVLSDRLGIPVNHQSCRRIKKTSAQKNLSARHRKQNLNQAFSVNDSFQGTSIAVVDDVLTTGTTVESLTRVLYSSGAIDVQVWTIARTPQPPAL